MAMLNLDPALQPLDTAVELQLALDDFNRRRLSPGLPNDAVEDRAREAELLERESRFIEAERRRVEMRAATAPVDPDNS